VRCVFVCVFASRYQQEEAADGLIHELLRDKDPILRYGGVFTIGLVRCC
jgi:hypothetical protein